MIRTIGIREIVLGLWRCHIIFVDVMVGIWVWIGGGVSRRGGTGVLNVADGGFFEPRVSMKWVYVNVSDDRRGGTGTGGAWTVTLGGAVSEQGSMGFGRGGRTDVRGVGDKGLVGW